MDRLPKHLLEHLQLIEWRLIYLKSEVNAMERIDAHLADATILNTVGDALPFSNLYAEQTTLVVFVRHFGCIFCRERLADLAEALPLLEAHGMGAVAIGNGTPLMAEAFSETLKVDIPIYTDPSRDIFKKAEMKRNFGLGFATIKQGLRSWKAGHRQGAVAGDPWQQGGCLLIRPDGLILAAERDHRAGDIIDFQTTVRQAIDAVDAA